MKPRRAPSGVGASRLYETVSLRFNLYRGTKVALVAAAALAACVVAAPEAAAQGCAMCGTAVTSPKDPLAKGMFISIVVMLAVPNLLLASIGGWLYYMYRRAALTGERT